MPVHLILLSLTALQIGRVTLFHALNRRQCRVPRFWLGLNAEMMSTPCRQAPTFNLGNDRPHAPTRACAHEYAPTYCKHTHTHTHTDTNKQTDRQTNNIGLHLIIAEERSLGSARSTLDRPRQDKTDACVTVCSLAMSRSRSWSCFLRQAILNRRPLTCTASAHKQSRLRQPRRRLGFEIPR